jgi:uncharacterized protein YqiB (DUF1249 family)
MAQKAYQYPFSTFMQQCELNYSLLCRLAPEQSEQTIHDILLDDGSLIQIELKERHRYTSFLILRHIFANQSSPILDFELSIRLYHDARQAEVFDPDGRAIHARLNYPNRQMQQTDEKLNINHFLGDLLQHCLHHGRSTEAII